MELTEILRLIHPVSDQSAQLLLERCENVSFKRKDMMISENEISQHLYIIKQGIVRCGFRHGKLEDTVLFALRGDAITSAHSMRCNLPSPFFYEVLTDTEALRINFSDFNALIEQNTDLLMWWQAYLVDGMYVLEHKYAYFAMKDAYERYVTFLGKRPELAKEIPVKYIAQYLNISRETLSRIRAKYVKD